MSELHWLVGSVAIYFGIIVAQAVFANLRYSPATLLGPRDDFSPDDKYLLRARRTLANMTEAMMMFVPLVLVVHLMDKTSTLTVIAAALFFWSRLAYAVVYIAGVGVVRSLVWAAGMVGVLMMLWAALAPAPIT